MNEVCGKCGTAHANRCGFKSIAWGPIVVGALFGVGLAFLLNLFSVAVGLTAFTTSPEGNLTLAVSGFVGLVIGSVVTMYIAGWVTGLLARPYCSKRNLGEIYGFAAWSLSLVLAIILTANAGNFVSHAGSVVNPQGTTVNVTTNGSKPLMTTQKQPSQTKVTVNAEKAATSLGVATFVTFFLFFMGAIASSFGGRMGMRSRRCDDNI